MNYSAMFLFGTFSWTISEVLSSLNASTNSQSSRSLENVAAQELFFKALKAQRESVCVCVWTILCISNGTKTVFNLTRPSEDLRYLSFLQTTKKKKKEEIIQFSSRRTSGRRILKAQLPAITAFRSQHGEVI